MDRIVIIGSGSFALTHAVMLANNPTLRDEGYELLMGVRPESKIARLGLEEVLASQGVAEKHIPGNARTLPILTTSDGGILTSEPAYILSVVASPYIFDSYRMIPETGFQTGSALISCTKSFWYDGSRGKIIRPSEHIGEIWPCDGGSAVLSGPNLSSEIMANYRQGTDRHTNSAVSVIGCEDEELMERLAAIFENKPVLSVKKNHDLVGVELWGALKNVLAIFKGYCDGYFQGGGTSRNELGAIIGQGFGEYTIFVGDQGGDPLTGLGDSGIGDYITTSESASSRNYRVGYYIGYHSGRGVPVKIGDALEVLQGQEAEGIFTLQALETYRERHAKDMPLTAAAYAVIMDGVPYETVREQMLSRPANYERPGRKV